VKALCILPLALLLQSNGCEQKKLAETPAPPMLSKSNKHKPCIDSSLIRRDAICPMNWMPVCGCDSVTYGNACAADAAGVTWHRQGECVQK
jgi:hypothetical protein